MFVKSQNINASRKNILFSLIAWILISIAVTTIYRYLDTYYTGWTPAGRHHLDTAHTVTQALLIVGIVVNVLNFIFREFEQSFLLSRTITKRFFPLLRAIIMTIIWIITGFYILDALAINTTNILAGAGIGGAILAFASKDFFSNLIGSLSILFSRTFEIGEFIRVPIKSTAIYEGIVEEITLNHTKITNTSGEVVYIPNRLIYTESVENLSRRRFFTYTYRIPFAKSTESGEVKIRIKIIEGKIMHYDPLDMRIETEIPNATDFVYKITVLLPEENKIFDDEIRRFLVDFIFSNKGAHSDVQSLQK